MALLRVKGKFGEGQFKTRMWDGRSWIWTFGNNDMREILCERIVAWGLRATSETPLIARRWTQMAQFEFFVEGIVPRDERGREQGHDFPINDLTLWVAAPEGFATSYSAFSNRPSEGRVLAYQHLDSPVEEVRINLEHCPQFFRRNDLRIMTNADAVRYDQWLENKCDYEGCARRAWVHLVDSTDLARLGSSCVVHRQARTKSMAKTLTLQPGFAVDKNHGPHRSNV